MPSGGPRSTAQPAVAESWPANDEVNVPTDSRIRIRFAEWIEPRAFPRAVSISPEPDGPPEFVWSGRTVEIRLPDRLQENTTYIITLDRTVRTWRGVGLTAPVAIAFSTGPVINRGRIDGRVLEDERGRPVSGIDVFAYAAADSAVPGTLPERPLYRTQTGEDGRFTMRNLAEQPYFVVALEDRNRNRRPDPGERLAPPPFPVVAADTLQREIDRPWIMPLADDRPPEATRARALSRTRVAVRFNRGVMLASADPQAWQVTSEADGRVIPARFVYVDPEEARQVIVVLPEDPGPGDFSVIPHAVTDSAGVAAAGRALTFAYSPDPDTLALRFREFTGGSGRTDDGIIQLGPADHPALLFNQPAGEDLLRSRLSVRTNDSDRGYSISFPDGLAATIRLYTALREGERLTVGYSPQDADTTYTQIFEPISGRDMGSIAGVVALPDKTATVVVEVRHTDGRLLHRGAADEAGRFRVDQVPAGHYRIRSFIDLDGNERWSPGAVDPYQAPEPLTWAADTLRVRARWESALSDTLRFESPRPDQPEVVDTTEDDPDDDTEPSPGESH
jgi:hypothetical protein